MLLTDDGCSTEKSLAETWWGCLTAEGGIRRQLINLVRWQWQDREGRMNNTDPGFLSSFVQQDFVCLPHFHNQSHIHSRTQARRGRGSSDPNAFITDFSSSRSSTSTLLQLTPPFFLETHLACCILLLFFNISPVLLSICLLCSFTKCCVCVIDEEERGWYDGVCLILSGQEAVQRWWPALSLKRDDQSVWLQVFCQQKYSLCKRAQSRY